MLGQKTPLDYRGDPIKSKRVLGLTLIAGLFILLLSGTASFGFYVGIFGLALAYTFYNLLGILPSIGSMIFIFILLVLLYFYVIYYLFTSMFGSSKQSNREKYNSRNK
jgi:phosphotransferase system  glucose/maltose/N-acetylglucosamine-specific IIC component